MNTSYLLLPSTQRFLPFFICIMCVTGNVRAQNTYTWSSTPTNSNWNTNTNWAPTFIPNGPNDIATFGLSNTSAVSLSASIEVNGITFNPGASGYTISITAPFLTMTVSGAGIINNSSVTQNFDTSQGASSNGIGGIYFTNAALAGSNTLFTNSGGSVASDSGNYQQIFKNTSSADHATFVNGAPTVSGAWGGQIYFQDSSTAGNGMFTNNGKAVSPGQGASITFANQSSAGQGNFTNEGDSVASNGFGTGVFFGGNSSASNGLFTNNAGTVSGARGGITQFVSTATAAEGTFTNNGGVLGSGGGETYFAGTSTAANATIINNALGSRGFTQFADTSTAGNATITNNGSAGSGGETIFSSSSTAGSAVLIANGGSGNNLSGGLIFFQDSSTGGTAEVKLFGNGALDISTHSSPGITLGSVEGSGNVFLGANALSVGSDNLSTSFSGAIQDGNDFGTGSPGGSLTKIGIGTLTLTGASTYTGPTTVSGGKLVINGSITSSVTIGSGGALGGAGVIMGSVASQGGGKIAPGDPTTLTINGNCEIDSGAILELAVAGTDPAQSDQLVVKGTTTIADGAILKLDFTNGFAPHTGDVFSILSSTTTTGSFSNVTISGLMSGFQYTVAPNNNGGFTLTAMNDGFPGTPSVAPLLNISTRLNVETGDNVLIGGFIITGTSAKQVLIRGIGPSLAGSVQGTLADPTLELHSGATTLATNDNWKTDDATGQSQEATIQATTIPPTNDAESAILTTLQPGAYTAILAGKDGATGVGLIEVYDLSPAVDTQTANISTRGIVQIGDNVIIGGFIVGGSNGDVVNVLVRAIGPSLTNAGVANALADPTLELHDGQGTLIDSNDNWRSDHEEEIQETSIPPTNDLESALIETLTPGNYTAIVRGKGDTTGVGLVEVYRLP